MEQVGKRREETMGWALDSSGRLALGGAERSDAVRNRRRILAAARALFEERGVTNVTMEEISRSAGVGKGTLYRRFPNKGLLCQALLDEPTRRFQAEVLLSSSDPEKGPLEKLRGFLSRLVIFTEENLDLLYGGHETLQGAERVAHYGHPAYVWTRWTVLGLLREAVRTGELDAEQDVEYLSDALLAPLNVDLYYYQRRIMGIPTERIRAGLRSLVPCR
ncbi:MAG: TetR/AcrR family transcriptional regulator [Actinomycetota bacterium]|nr:TetR/AcrR family transcriptional regulator [Actinomycetota bacterium]